MTEARLGESEAESAIRGVEADRGRCEQKDMLRRSHAIRS
jgi:hypothetical protein